MARKARSSKGRTGAAKAQTPPPDEEFARLEADLQRGLPRAVLLRGEEHWYRQQAIEGIVELAKARGLELCRHDTADPEFQLATLLDDLAGGALFGGGRCVVVRGAGELLRKGSRVFREGTVNAMLARLQAESEDCLVLDAESLRADNKVAKAASAQGLSYTFRKLWDTPPPWRPDPRHVELVQWVQRRARAHGLDVRPDQAVYVAVATGNDLAALDAQLQRAASAGGKFEDAVVWDPGGSPWAIAEQLVDGAAARAVAQLEGLFRGGFVGKDGRREQASEALVAMLGPAVSGKAREALATVRQGGPRAGSPRQKEALAARAGKRSAEDWARMVDDAAALERRARSGPSVGVEDWSAFALRWRIDDRRGRR